VTADNCAALAIGNKGANVSNVSVVKDSSITFE
jgi:hypothetical protein